MMIQWHFVGFSGIDDDIPSGFYKQKLLKMATEIVGLPIKDADFP